MYIVVFNLGYKDHQLMIDEHGFIEEFAEYEHAEAQAKEWLDADQYRTFNIYEQH